MIQFRILAGNTPILPVFAVKSSVFSYLFDLVQHNWLLPSTRWCHFIAFHRFMHQCVFINVCSLWSFIFQQNRRTNHLISGVGHHANDIQLFE